MSDLYVKIKYRVDDGSFNIDSNIKEDKIQETLSEFLRTQMGTGTDSSKYVERDEYEIQINIDLSNDTFTVNSNAGNKSLTTGIIMNVVNNLK